MVVSLEYPNLSGTPSLAQGVKVKEPAETSLSVFGMLEGLPVP